MTKGKDQGKGSNRSTAVSRLQRSTKDVWTWASLQWTWMMPHLRPRALMWNTWRQQRMLVWRVKTLFRKRKSYKPTNENGRK
ncbi:hypothetical protein ACOMHN_032420 [Nucella lapillus]